jgi:hypothetical protein
MTRNAAACLILLLLPCLAAGCSRKIVTADNPAPLSADLYKTYFDTAIDVLRDNGYVIDRNDYRFGTITTLGQGSPTVLEVWNPQNTTGRQAVESTLADEQRRVNVTFTKNEQQAPTGTGSDPVSETDTSGGGYAIEVEVILERRQTPTRRVNGSARRNVFTNLSAVPKELADKGVTGNYWQPVGRDAYLEARLMKQINDRVAKAE